MAKMKIKLTKEQQQMIVFAVMFLGGGGFAFFKYFWIPTSAKIAKTQVELDEVNGKIKTAISAQSRMKDIERQLKSLKDKMKVLASACRTK